MTRARTVVVAAVAALTLVGATVAVVTGSDDPATPTAPRASASAERPLVFTLARVSAGAGQPLATTVRDGALLLRLPCPLTPTALAVVGEDLRVDVAAGPRSACGGRSGADLPDLVTLTPTERRLSLPLRLEVRGDTAFATYEGTPVRRELLLEAGAPLPPPPPGVRSCGDDRADALSTREQRCLLDAFEDGEPASLSLTSYTVEGDPITQHFLVTGRRTVHVVTDSRQDAYGAPSVVIRECADLRAREAAVGRPLLVEDDCS